jgi:hypothetical protein
MSPPRAARAAATGCGWLLVAAIVVLAAAEFAHHLGHMITHLGHHHMPGIATAGTDVLDILSYPRGRHGCFDAAS